MVLPSIRIVSHKQDQQLAVTISFILDLQNWPCCFSGQKLVVYVLSIHFLVLSIDHQVIAIQNSMVGQQMTTNQTLLFFAWFLYCIVI